MQQSTAQFDAKTTGAVTKLLADVSQPKRVGFAPAQSSLVDVCTMLGVSTSPAMLNEPQMFTHIHLKEGQRLFSMGQPLESIYIVHSGFLKMVQNDDYGSESILSFPMKGDLLGADALYLRAYQSDCVALTSSVVVAVPYKSLKQLNISYPGLDSELMQVMSKYLVEQQHLLTMVNTLSAEARVARFVVSLSQRFEEMGYSSKAFSLRMTRLEIGAHLGLTLETVSRTLSLLKDCGYIDVDQRNITIKDGEALRTLKRTPVRKKTVKTGETGVTTVATASHWASGVMTVTTPALA